MAHVNPYEVPRGFHAVQRKRESRQPRWVRRVLYLHLACVGSTGFLAIVDLGAIVPVNSTAFPQFVIYLLWPSMYAWLFCPTLLAAAFVRTRSWSLADMGLSVVACCALTLVQLYCLLPSIRAGL